MIQLQPIATLKNHTGPVNGVSAICLLTCQNQSVTMTTYVTTSSADSTVNIWKQENDGGKYYTVHETFFSKITVRTSFVATFPRDADHDDACFVVDQYTYW
jgi:hypothetical protein